MRNSVYLPSGRQARARLDLPSVQLDEFDMDTTPFSNDYATARRRFVQACREVGACHHVLRLMARGPEDLPLTIDIGWLGSERPAWALIHVSGVHGVEGFAGSAIQLSLLESRPEIHGPGAVIFIHALNPYGMAWRRRCNECNVDLNRNFLADSTPRHGTPGGYEQMASLLNPPSPPTRDGFYLRAAWLLLRHGRQPLAQAVMTGQFDNPRGPSYAGGKCEEGSRLYAAWLTETMLGIPQLGVIDVHTGLGRWRHNAIVHKVRDTESRLLAERLGIRSLLSSASESLTGYTFGGGHCAVYPERLPGTTIDFLTQEFGTYPALRMLHAMREENRLHHYGQRNVDHPAKQRMLAAFCPPSAQWRESVVSDGCTLFRNMLAWLEETPRATMPVSDATQVYA